VCGDEVTWHIAMLLLLLLHRPHTTRRTCEYRCR